MMRTTFVRLAVAIALVAGAYASWMEARRAARAADASQLIATLQFSDVEAGADPATTATVAYWLGRYGSVTADTTSGEFDPYVLRTAANAAFRAYEREPGAGPAAVQRLDGVLQAYASALKASPRDIDAAFNYEYVARLRDVVARAKGKPSQPAPVAPPQPLVAGDLPAGPTIHGRPGMPPPDAKMEELQMLAPMEYGDREAQPEATPGGKRERKG
jgi:hypothetical protein